MNEPLSSTSLSADEGAAGNRRVFVPFSEDLYRDVFTEILLEGEKPLGELVPFQIEYECVRLLDGTYEFRAPALHSDGDLVHAA